MNREPLGAQPKLEKLEERHLSVSHSDSESEPKFPPLSHYSFIPPNTYSSKENLRCSRLFHKIQTNRPKYSAMQGKLLVVQMGGFLEANSCSSTDSLPKHKAPTKPVRVSCSPVNSIMSTSGLVGRVYYLVSENHSQVSIGRNQKI